VKPLSEALGSVLRDLRRERGLTLDQVSERSGGLFKASSVAAYETGKRAITLDRFCVLGILYGLPPDRMLSLVLERLDPGGRRPFKIDLGSLELLREQGAQTLRDYVHDVIEVRKDHETEVVTLRSGDVEALNLLGVKSPALLEQVGDPAP
jgi:transcriptional regulator with XRE-family HTH domain